jgi:hypothetical protein
MELVIEACSAFTDDQDILYIDANIFYLYRQQEIIFSCDCAHLIFLTIPFLQIYIFPDIMKFPHVKKFFPFLFKCYSAKFLG